jgi:hypothetical protein
VIGRQDTLKNGRLQTDYPATAAEIRGWNHATAVAMLRWLDMVTRTGPQYLIACSEAAALDNKDFTAADVRRQRMHR